MPEEESAHVVLDAQADAAGEPAARHGEARPCQADRDHRQAQPRQQIAPACGQDVVDHPPREVWQGDGARHQPSGAGGGEDDLASIGAEEAQQAAERGQVIHW
jgi:hypothetical protein